MSRMDLPNSDSRPAPSNEVPRQNGPVCVPAHGPSTWPDGVSLPSLDDVWERAHVVQLPMNIRFRGIMQREVMLIDGPHGWSEWGAFLEYGPAESAMWLASALEMGWVGPPALLRGWVPVNGTIPACDPARVPELLDRYAGISTVKVKVAEKGQTLDDDCARIRAVREARPDINIRVDANGGWTVAEAHEAVRRFLHDGPLDYVEQPCPHLEDLADLRNMLVDEGLSARIAADESIRKASDPYRAIRMGAIDVAVVKAAPLGGPRNVIAVAE
ncbi:MAG: o-succinylbenzoate synthase, partial [Corynebacterium kroppenstedtii]|nr:o-succinylbenzoate synthase [Corynebacterium kroppenstedtii]